ncbi:MAG: hypothetical protein JXR94_02460 [Candidatus Hydrogenedentes bacterium]|nr:hypothetical protein [Candidatus Hydrogenedentota bacterium]
MLNIVLAVLGLTCVPVGMLLQHAGPPTPGGYAPSDAVVGMYESMETPFYRAYSAVSTTVGIVAAIALLAAGVGLLKLRPWGRSLSIVYAIYGLIVAVVLPVVNYFIVWRPMLDTLQGVGGPAEFGFMIALVSGTVGSCLNFVYPVLLLIFMFRPHVKRAFLPPDAPPLPET